MWYNEPLIGPRRAEALAMTDADFEREKWQTDLRLRERELDLKERELRRSQWTSPLALALFAAAFAALGNAVVAGINGYYNRLLETTRSAAQQELEDRKAEAARIFEVIKTGDPTTAIKNLEFLHKTGLIKDDEIRNNIKSLVAEMRLRPEDAARLLAEIEAKRRRAAEIWTRDVEKPTLPRQ
jgi:hypothetical protein